jgi:hypothetical protein
VTAWKWVATRLGDRMQHHAHCAAHPLPEADPINCPFCDDRAAYLEYVAKVREARRAHAPAGPEGPETP